ncbi:MAG: DUF1592 domain-containing protein [Planctomycetaceae bacterium]
MARPFLVRLVRGVTAMAAAVAALACQMNVVYGDAPSALDGTAGHCIQHNSFQEVWIKVAERLCLKCHVTDGDAGDSELVIRDVARVAAAEQATVMRNNAAVLGRMASRREPDGRARLLVKATGGLEHGGGEVVKAGSTELRVLEAFVLALRRKTSRTPIKTPPESSLIDQDLASFFDGVKMISDQRLLRRVTLSLAARLPTAGERQAVDRGGLAAIRSMLPEIMTERAFEERLLEGLNDIFLTRGYIGNGDDVLSYDHFEHTRHWYQKHSLDHLPEKDRQKARYKLADDYREALRREPLELIRYIVSQGRPFSEILTADYTMVSPYTARGYGLYEELKDQFKDPEDPFEYIPARLKALKARSGKVQPTADGHYPHAGLLTTFQYLRRYPTTETNRNRLRSRMYYQHFLGIDVMSLAPRVSDSAAIDAAYEIPTMQAAECVVCHTTLDPIAGLFQDYYNEEGHYGPRKDGWFADMFPPGREGVDLPESDRWRALQWLGSKTVDDPRFATAITEHVYYILMGRKVLLRPDDIDDPQFASRRRAYLAQRAIIQNAAQRFAEESFNLKAIFEELILSPLYRADALATKTDDPTRLAELEDVGLVRMLGPEQMERKIMAVFGKPWGRLTDSYAILYGGIDSEEVTERLTEPSGAIGALQRMLANDVACENVAADFAMPARQRRLFPSIELDVVPGPDDAASQQRVRIALAHLHQHILGREDPPDSGEVDRSYQLFAGVIADAQEQDSFEPVESYFCKSGEGEDPRDADPHYTLRAWRAVVTYLLRQTDFLYE